MRETEVSSVGGLLEATAEFEAALGRPTWYRGHYGSTWKLIPGAFREPVNRGEPGYERIVSQVFQLRAGARRERCPNRSDYGSWLYLMQHYRLPTRLLDWSESPMVAAFFALWNDADPRRVESDDAVVYVLAPRLLNERQAGLAMIVLLGDEEAEGLVPHWLLPPSRAAAEMPTRSGEGPSALAIMPEQIDPRIVAQQGTFTIHAPGVALEDLEGSGDFLARIVIPASAREAMRRDLLRMGVRPMNLFPDLDHLSLDLKNFEHVI